MKEAVLFPCSRAEKRLRDHQCLIIAASVMMHLRAVRQKWQVGGGRHKREQLTLQQKDFLEIPQAKTWYSRECNEGRGGGGGLTD